MISNVYRGIPFGIGLLAIFQGSYQYMIDAYGPFASSAVSPPHLSPLKIQSHKDVARRCYPCTIWLALLSCNRWTTSWINIGGSGLVILAFPTMYQNLGNEWATSYVPLHFPFIYWSKNLISVFAFLGLALTPVPFVFYRYGVSFLLLLHVDIVCWLSTYRTEG